MLKLLILKFLLFVNIFYVKYYLYLYTEYHNKDIHNIIINTSKKTSRNNDGQVDSIISLRTFFLACVDVQKCSFSLMLWISLLWYSVYRFEKYLIWNIKTNSKNFSASYLGKNRNFLWIKGKGETPKGGNSQNDVCLIQCNLSGPQIEPCFKKVSNVVQQFDAHYPAQRSSKLEKYCTYYFPTF